MALSSSHVNTLAGLQPGMIFRDHYPTHRLRGGTGCTKERAAPGSSQEQKETTKWEEDLCQ